MNTEQIWKSCFKDMCVGAYKKFVEFASDHLSKGVHVKTDGELANPTSEMKARMVNTKPTNKIAESVFGSYDRLLGRITNASSVTLQAMTAAKLTKPFEWVRKNTTQEQFYHLFKWARKVLNQASVFTK